MMGENGFRVDAGDAIRKGGTEVVGLICGWVLMVLKKFSQRLGVVWTKTVLQIYLWSSPATK